MSNGFLKAASIGLFLGLSLSGQAQTAQPLPTDPAYTLHTSARVVLTDVVVLDKNGQPVRGLDRSAFHLFDNNRPQQVASFQEHTPEASVADTSAPHAKNVFSNDFLLHPPSAFNVIMLDTSTIGIVDQMYLREELTHLIDDLPAGQQLAIFVHAGEFTILLQNFTSDHAELLAAIAKAVPRLKQPGAEYSLDVAALQQMATYLGQLPGRKNVMWYTGGSNLFLKSDPTAYPIGVDMRAIYDQLEQARIAIYPIDVRGPIVGTTSAAQHMLMREQAQATGGHAFVNTNGLAESARQVVDNGANYYTLTYSPQDFKFDNKWHKVKVQVDGGKYQVSYRQGYYGDGSGVKPAEKPNRTLLKAQGETVNLPDNRSQPIIFTAQLMPGLTGAAAALVPTAAEAPAKRGQETYTLHYVVPASAFTQTHTTTGQQVEVGAGLLIFNGFGRAVGRQSEKFTLTFDGDKLTRNPNGTLGFDQKVTLPKGDDYLYVVVWDMKTGRMGTLQVPVVATKQ